MNCYRVRLTLICPSDWTEQNCRSYIERICPTSEEKNSVSISPCLFPGDNTPLAGKKPEVQAESQT